MNGTPNAEIRDLLRIYRLQYVEIARKLGISEKRFHWLMSKEFNPSFRRKVKNAIHNIIETEGL